MKKILFGIFIFLILVFITINLLTIFNIPLFGYRIYRVGSGSMQPYLNINDIILVKKQKKYQVNDVVTYVNNNEYITHRIVSIKNDEIILKGDANNIEDKPIKNDSIIGKVIFKTVGFGFILYLFSKPIFWILLFIIGFIFTIFIPDKKKL